MEYHGEYLMELEKLDNIVLENKELNGRKHLVKLMTMEELKVILKLLDLLELKQWKKNLNKTNREEFKEKIEIETKQENVDNHKNS